MKRQVNLQSALLAAANQNRNRADPGTVGEEPLRQTAQPLQDDGPKLPEGYRPIRDAIRALLILGGTTASEE